MYVRVRGFQIFEDRGGRVRCYHRATRTAVDLVAFPIGSVEFFAECARIAALASAKAEEAARPGTLGALVVAYRGHPAFQDLAPRTRKDYGTYFDYLRPIADTPLTKFTPPLVVKIRDKAAETKGRRFADLVKTVLSVIFRWGVERGYLKTNPAASIRNLGRAKGAPEANRPWSDGERHAVLSALPRHMLPAIALMAYTGMDPQDALRLPRGSIKDGRVDMKRGKTGQSVWLPLADPVLAAIAAAPAHDAITICANSRGVPWTVSGFRASWRPIRARLELAGEVEPGLTLKGLRHTVGGILRELALDNRTIADVLGHKTETMAAHYSRRADLTEKNTATIERFSVEMARRTARIVKPATGSVKPVSTKEQEK
ncbi:tyrosine-type recombinase/integrase [Aureimonas pseudogalii]|uniref:Integrase n=1 Tax=Aureimonas pseudogalii TaxID=1744844 RepID=A0A7W6H625_9HYPH|nr:tyrosine-type recombinase/integrase [Aureimonas pseudogalii]MBB3999249.1 integrase [Aureimonas pseudogalii]